MSGKKIIAGDIGGSHLTLALFEADGTDLQLVNSIRTHVDSTQEKNEIFNDWLKVFEQLNFNPYQSGIALAMPAPFDYGNGICLIEEQAKFNSLYKVNIKEELSARIGISDTQIKFVNDAEAFLHGESAFGAGIHEESLLGITLGSGLGSALKKGEKIWDAGLWSAPFNDSYAENYLATGWFINQVKEKFGIDLPGVKEIISYQDLKQEIPSLFELYAKNLADFIFSQFTIHHFQKVIIGGNITRSAHLFLEEVIQFLLEKEIQIPVEVSKLGEQSALYGAASLFNEK